MEPELTETPQEPTQSLQTGSTNENTEFEFNQLISEADRIFEGTDETIQTEIETETNLEPTKYTRAVTKIQRFDTKLRVLSMRDKALKKHSKAVKSLLESGKLQEAEDLTLQVPGNEKLDEECTDYDGIFHQTEITNKQIHFPPINNQNSLVGAEPENTFLTEQEENRLEELLEDETCPSLVTPESIGMLEIDTKLELIGGLTQTPNFEDTSSLQTDIETILSREKMENPFTSEQDLSLKRIDTALELLASQSLHDNLTVSPAIDTLLSEIHSL